MRNLREELSIELPRAKGAYLLEAPEAIWTNPNWVLEVKADGTRESLQIGTQRSLMVGRNRQDKLKGVGAAGPFMVHPHPIFDTVQHPDLAGTILDGELTMHFVKEGVFDENTLKRAACGQFVGYSVWGVLFFQGHDVRSLDEAERYSLARMVVNTLAHKNMRMLERVPATRENLQAIWDRGEEGAIAKYLKAHIPTTQRTCPTWIKLKTEKTVDAFIIGVTQGKEGGSGVRGVKPTPNGKAASFTMGMYRDGKIVEVCKLKHLPDDIAEAGWREFTSFDLRVIEMTVSGYNGKEFRWPRFKKFRDDKTPRECQFAEQVGSKEAA